MRNLGLITLTVLISSLIAGCVQRQPDPIEQGRALAMMCGDCHTPKTFTPTGLPVQDSTRMFSGHPMNEPYPLWAPADMQRSVAATTNPMLTAWAGPWGVSFAANITPDTSTGIGEWTEESFILAMRSGKHQGYSNSRDILPPMPWENFKVLSDQEVKALWAYLRSLPPVHNQVPFPIPPNAPAVSMVETQ